MIDQLPDYSFSLSQAEYCLELKQIDLDSAQTEGISAAEMTQARALLGAIQWRVQQTAPQLSSHGFNLLFLVVVVTC